MFNVLYVSIFLSQDSKHSKEIVTSPSLDVFLPEDEDNPYESVTTAVTRKPCSLDINHRLNSSPRNGKATLHFIKAYTHDTIVILIWKYRCNVGILFENNHCLHSVFSYWTLVDLWTCFVFGLEHMVLSSVFHLDRVYQQESIWTSRCCYDHDFTWRLEPPNVLSIQVSWQQTGVENVGERESIIVWDTYIVEFMPPTLSGSYFFTGAWVILILDAQIVSKSVSVCLNHKCVSSKYLLFSIGMLVYHC